MCYRMILHFKWSSLNFKINTQCPGSHGTSICIDDLFLFIPSSAYSFLPTLFKIILFWDYNVIKSFPFPFLSPHPPIHLSLLSVKFVASLWIIVYILLVCLFSGITICNWRTNWPALPWGRLFLVLFVYGWSILSFSLIHIKMSIVLFISYQDSHVGETMGIAFDMLRRPIS